MTETKKKNWFWTVQISTWFIIGLINYLFQKRIPKIQDVILYLNFVNMTAGGLLITTAYRYYLKRYHQKLRIRGGKFILFLLGSSLLQAIGWLLLICLFCVPFYKKYSFPLFPPIYNIIPLFALILIWNLAYLSYRLISENHLAEVERWKLEAEVQKSQLGALKAQINPHFMFNALNNIRALILENPVQARDMLTKFSELFRYALQHSEEKEASAAEELKILTQYLELLKIQYEEKLQYFIDADTELLKELIPPMVLQLLVENAVKHGIGLSSTGGSIWITLKRSGTKLLLSVKNTGKIQQGSPLEESLGIGLNNIKERLKLLYGNKASLHMEEEANFVTVTISLEKHL
ncbi:sensor histidine kinase [Pedobacter nutrimenti]|uniref:sensor histidine kinase n=1 Tax=Pedobacter nutrimenti TaxID=1241337 RepID=UPI00293163DA|nr:histidine kinase [Pedobacter nutrimenti]